MLRLPLQLPVRRVEVEPAPVAEPPTRVARAAMPAGLPRVARERHLNLVLCTFQI